MYYDTELVKEFALACYCPKNKNLRLQEEAVFEILTRRVNIAIGLYQYLDDTNAIRFICRSPITHAYDNNKRTKPAPRIFRLRSVMREHAHIERAASGDVIRWMRDTFNCPEQFLKIPSREEIETCTSTDIIYNYLLLDSYLFFASEMELSRYALNNIIYARHKGLNMSVTEVDFELWKRNLNNKYREWTDLVQWTKTLRTCHPLYYLMRSYYKSYEQIMNNIPHFDPTRSHSNTSDDLSCDKHKSRWAKRSEADDKASFLTRPVQRLKTESKYHYGLPNTCSHFLNFTREILKPSWAMCRSDFQVANMLEEDGEYVNSEEDTKRLYHCLSDLRNFPIVKIVDWLLDTFPSLPLLIDELSDTRYAAHIMSVDDKSRVGRNHLRSFLQYHRKINHTSSANNKSQDDTLKCQRDQQQRMRDRIIVLLQTNKDGRIVVQTQSATQILCHMLAYNMAHEDHLEHISMFGSADEDGKDKRMTADAIERFMPLAKKYFGEVSTIDFDDQCWPRVAAHYSKVLQIEQYSSSLAGLANSSSSSKPYSSSRQSQPSPSKSLRGETWERGQQLLHNTSNHELHHLEPSLDKTVGRVTNNKLVTESESEQSQGRGGMFKPNVKPLNNRGRGERFFSRGTTTNTGRWNKL